MDTERMIEKFQCSPALQDLADRLFRCTAFIIRKGLENAVECEAMIQNEDLWQFDIDPNHDFTAIDTLTALLCERTEVEQLKVDGDYQITFKPEACRLYGLLPGFIQQVLAGTENDCVYLDSARLQDLTGVDIRQDDSRELFFSMLDGCPEVTNWFYNEDLSGIGLEFDPKLCQNTREPEPSEMQGPRL